MIRQNRFVTDKATIVPSMSLNIKKKQKRKLGTKVKSNKIRIVKGRVLVKVPGYKGLQKLAPSHLIQHISKKNIKSAASSVLKKGSKPIKRKYKKKKKAK